MFCALRGKQDSSDEDGELLGNHAMFFKYVRLGAVNLSVSTHGYKLVRLKEFKVNKVRHKCAIVV